MYPLTVTRQVAGAALWLALLAWLLHPVFAMASDGAVKSPEQAWISAISNDRADTLLAMLDVSDTPGRLLATVALNGKDALMVACKTGDLELVKHMALLGANINSVTHTGGTPLMFAALGNHVHIARWLHQHKASLDSKGTNGWSAATIAGAKGFTGFLDWLESAGAQIDEPDVYGFTPLMRAVDNRHLAAAALLLESNKVDVASGDESGNTALHFAAANRHVEMVALLIRHGADAQQENRDGFAATDLVDGNTQLRAMME